LDALGFEHDTRAVETNQVVEAGNGAFASKFPVGALIGHAEIVHTF
jgi:hypothetical protein